MFLLFRDILVGTNTTEEELEAIIPKVGKQNGLRIIIDQVIFIISFLISTEYMFSLSWSMYNVVVYVQILKASGNAELGTIFDATNSFDIFIGSSKEFPMMGLR